ncbi:hypothetical protein PM082_023897 [Marasmius tenuissimus]|nr:hypothetical protein PM082_023897 [Marasmius tenuissimus]
MDYEVEIYSTPIQTRGYEFRSWVVYKAYFFSPTFSESPKPPHPPNARASRDGACQPTQRSNAILSKRQAFKVGRERDKFNGMRHSLLLDQEVRGTGGEDGEGKGKGKEIVSDIEKYKDKMKNKHTFGRWQRAWCLAVAIGLRVEGMGVVGGRWSWVSGVVGDKGGIVESGLPDIWTVVSGRIYASIVLL